MWWVFLLASKNQNSQSAFLRLRTPFHIVFSAFWQLCFCCFRRFYDFCLIFCRFVYFSSYFSTFCSQIIICNVKLAFFKQRNDDRYQLWWVLVKRNFSAKVFHASYFFDFQPSSPSRIWQSDGMIQSVLHKNQYISATLTATTKKEANEIDENTKIQTSVLV